MHRSLLKPIVIAFALAALALQPLPARGQDDQPTKPPAAPRIDLDFPGGTALDYVNAIRAAEPSANVVVLGDLARIKMAGVKLRGVNVWSALRVLDQIPADQGNMIAKITLDDVAGMPPAVFAVTAEIKDRGPGPDAMQTTVISMADMLASNLKAGDALSAIETALGLIQAASTPAQIKFHEETGLLIARGSPEQIETIQQVIRQLRERQGALEVRAQSDAASRDRREQMAMAFQENAKAREEADMLTRQLTEQRTRAGLLQQAVDEFRQQVSTLEAALRATQAEREALARAVDELRAKAKEPRP